MKKVFVCAYASYMPTIEKDCSPQILQSYKDQLEKILDEKVEILTLDVNRLKKDVPNSTSFNKTYLWWMSKAIELLAQADICAFTQCWRSDLCCQSIHDICERSSTQIVYLPYNRIEMNLTQKGAPTLETLPLGCTYILAGTYLGYMILEVVNNLGRLEFILGDGQHTFIDPSDIYCWEAVELND